MVLAILKHGMSIVRCRQTYRLICLVLSRVNPVETLFASFPMFMYLDPTLGRPLLEPLLRFQDSAEYTRDFAADDIGTISTLTPSWALLIFAVRFRLPDRTGFFEFFLSTRRGTNCEHVDHDVRVCTYYWGWRFCGSICEFVQPSHELSPIRNSCFHCL